MRESEFERLYERIEKPLYNVVYRWVWRPADAQEIVQEAFVRLWRMRSRIDGRTVEALVYRIALNLAASQRRAARVRSPVSLELVGETQAPGPSAEQRIEHEQRLGELRAAVESLPDALRRAVVLCECTDLTYEQIGGILSIPAGTVGSRRHRALQLLRHRLERAAEPGPDDERANARTV